MRELWLLRHGKSDREVLCPDFDRPLKPRGRRSAQRLGDWLQTWQLRPDLIVTSPARRALDTAQLIHSTLGLKQQLTQDHRLYLSGLDEIKAVLAECPATAGRIMLVGHNPDFEELLAELVDAEQLPDVEKIMPTAALARLEMPDDWHQLSAGCARLIEMIYAKTLEEYDAQQGKKKRRGAE